MKKIIMISNMYPSKDYPSYGVFVKNFEQMAIELGYDVDKIVLNKKTNKLSKIIAYIKYYLKIIVKVVLGKYDAVYVHYAAHNALPLLIASWFKNFKLFSNVHGSDVIPEKASQYKYQKLVNKLLKKSEYVVCPSEYFKSVVAKKFDIDKNKILTFPSAGVNNKIFFKYEEDAINNLKNQYGIDRNKKIIGYVGRIDTKKGWDVLLKALSNLKKENYLEDKIAIVVGNGQEFGVFNNMINELELREVVHHIDLLPQQKLPEIYNMIDVFCFPTMREGESLGLVALEAMACGTQVIGSDFAALKDYIYEDVNGLKFKVGDEEELSSKIKEFFNQTENKMMFLRENASKTSKKYLASNLMVQLADILNKI